MNVVKSQRWKGVNGVMVTRPNGKNQFAVYFQAKCEERMIGGKNRLALSFCAKSLVKLPQVMWREGLFASLHRIFLLGNCIPTVHFTDVLQEPPQFEALD
jgi:hypothetical protein